MSTSRDGTLGPRLLAPGRPNEPYVLDSLRGETIYIPCSKSVMRLVVTGKETDNAFAIVGTSGAAGDPIGFHFHREAHDVFLCLKGSLNVWANDQCRTMGPGDFASVPPGVVHQYQILGDHSEFIGLIVPGGWEEFFRFIGEPYDGPLFPLVDDRDVFKVLIPKLIAATEKFDMIPARDHPSSSPQAWADGKDNTLPGDVKPYFLRAGSGPRYLLGGVVFSPLAGAAESGARFSIGSIEGYSAHNEHHSLSKKYCFHDVHHCLYVVEGSVICSLDAEEIFLIPGRSVYIPRGHTFSLSFSSRYAKAYIFTNGDGLPGLFTKAGTPFHQSIPPAEMDRWEMSSLTKLEDKLSFTVQ